MTVFDLIVIAIVAVSVGISIWRGMVREVLALASWIGAFWIAKELAGLTATLLPDSVTNPGIRLMLGFIAVMLVSLLVFSLAGMLIVHLVKVAGLTASDRMLGAAFGLLRGVLIAVTVVLLGGMTSAPREKYWRDALLSAPLEAAALWVKPWLPRDVARRISFE
ncbi:MAG TPA: CvpA family protein [Burkholderiales bacterium]|jgi:membrane protein required for colicin V production|nr:CvpA family protein [Burkholderiales bacterium]